MILHEQVKEYESNSAIFASDEHKSALRRQS